MKDEELKTLKELIYSFDQNFYKQQNDRIQKEIFNINMGRPRFEGISDISSDIVPENQREKEINRLMREQEDNRQKSEELGQILSQLRLASNKLEKLAEKDLLLYAFRNSLDSFYSNGVKIDLLEKSGKKYYKLWLISIKPIVHSQQKISREMYELIKENLYEYAYKTPVGYDSIDSGLSANKIYLESQDTPANKIFNDFQKDYRGFENSKNIEQLGVDVNSIQYARSQIGGDLDLDSLTWQGKGAFNKIKNIEQAQKTNVETRGGYFKLEEIKEKYTKVIELSREIWYVEKILRAFATTKIIETEMYKGLQDLNREQELKLTKLTVEVDKLYEKTGLQNKINLIEQLENLYNKIEELSLKILKYQQMGNYRQADLIKQDYYKIRYEMVKILKDNPDLNNPKYNINIKDILKKEMELLEPEIKRETIKEESSYIKTDEGEIFVESSVPKNQIANEPTIKIANNQEVDSAHVQPKEEVFVEKTYIGETDKSLELEGDLQAQRTMHYQGYMLQKVLNSDLGKLSFSAYLESVAPHLIKLINIEKRRERLARTIYKDYLRYCSSLENKKSVIAFSVFAGKNYGISNIDVPIEHDEEYKGMMIKRNK